MAQLYPAPLGLCADGEKLLQRGGGCWVFQKGAGRRGKSFSEGISVVVTPRTSSWSIRRFQEFPGNSLGDRLNPSLFSAGYRHWHADLRPDDTPLEAGLAFTCKLKSGIRFLGREALEAQKATGVSRRLVCFTVEE